MLSQLMELISLDALTVLFVGLLRFLATILAAFLAGRIASRLIRSLRTPMLEAMGRGAGGSPMELEKRATTLVSMVRKAAVFCIWGIALVMALKELGFDIGPILAGAGVVGLAVGFGAQNLVRDVITGLFMLVENQIRVGDVAVINGTGGLVEEVNLRTTVLRGLDGTVHVFTNGGIGSLSNKTREFSCHVFDIGVAYKEDVDRVMKAIEEVGADLRKTDPYSKEMLEPVEIFGVDAFADSAVIIKGRIKTQPSQQWRVGREFNRRIKRRFDELGIEIPFPHRSIYFGEASKPFRVNGGDARPGELRGLREVVAEGAPKESPAG